jgi:hypothetical protein
MEPEGSLLSSQELSTCIYPEPNQYSPQHSILSLKGPSKCYLSTYVSVFLVVNGKGTPDEILVAQHGHEDIHVSVTEVFSAV